MAAVGQVGWEQPDTKSRGDRWAEAAPKMAMALSEAGCPTRHYPCSFVQPMRVHELSFLVSMPTDEMLQKAADLCGIGDLISEWLATRGDQG